jgi:hypothetical protein
LSAGVSSLKNTSTDLLNKASARVKNAINQKRGHIESDRHLKQLVIDTLSHFLFKGNPPPPHDSPVVVEV